MRLVPALLLFILLLLTTSAGLVWARPEGKAANKDNFLKEDADNVSLPPNPAFYENNYSLSNTNYDKNLNYDDYGKWYDSYDEKDSTWPYPNKGNWSYDNYGEKDSNWYYSNDGNWSYNNYGEKDSNWSYANHGNWSYDKYGNYGNWSTRNDANLTYEDYLKSSFGEESNWSYEEYEYNSLAVDRADPYENVQDLPNNRDSGRLARDFNNLWNNGPPVMATDRSASGEDLTTPEYVQTDQTGDTDELARTIGHTDQNWTIKMAGKKWATENEGKNWTNGNEDEKWTNESDDEIWANGKNAQILADKKEDKKWTNGNEDKKWTNGNEDKKLTNSMEDANWTKDEKVMSDETEQTSGVFENEDWFENVK